MPTGQSPTTNPTGVRTMALKATTQRFGTGARQRNSQRTPAQMYAYVKRTYGLTAATAWQHAYSEGGLVAAANALAPYRYSHR
jgi:hypothetical protein